MAIFIAADHRGFELKNKLVDWLKAQEYQVEDCGNTVYDPEDDYPDFAKKVVRSMMTGGMGKAKIPVSNDLGGAQPNGSEASTPTGVRNVVSSSSYLGILICGSGVGMAIAANRYRGLYCALGFDAGQIKHARENDHINVLSLPSDYIDFEKAKEIIEVFLTAKPKEEEKYVRRIRKLDNI